MITCRGRGKVARVITKILTEYRLKILFFDKNSHIFGSKCNMVQMVMQKTLIGQLKPSETKDCFT